MKRGSLRWLRWIGGLALVVVGCGGSTHNNGDAGAATADLAVPDLALNCGPTMTDPSFTVSATLVYDGGTRTFAPGDTISIADCQLLCGVEPYGFTCTAELGDGGAPVVVCQPGAYNGCS